MNEIIITSGMQTGAWTPEREMEGLRNIIKIERREHRKAVKDLQAKVERLERSVRSYEMQIKGIARNIINQFPDLTEEE